MIEINLKQHEIQTLKNVEIFSDLDEDELIALANISVGCSFPKGTVIYREEDKPEFIYVIAEGRIKSFSHSLSGKVIIANISKDVIGLQNIVSGKPLWVSAEAMEDVRTLRLSRQDFLAFIKPRPLLLLKLLKRAEQTMNSLFNRLNDLIDSSADQRVIDILFALHEKFGSALPFRIAEVASLAGLTRETTIRVLSRLTKDRIIKSNRTGITIIDVNTLRTHKQHFPIM
jgi:CRP/FNR family transcriptional regulator, cyclic AMP receptor protein